MGSETGSSFTYIHTHAGPQVGDVKEVHMKRTVVMLSALVILGGWNLRGLSPAYAITNGLEPVVWNSNQKSSAWAEELLGQVVTYQTMAEKSLIPGSFQSYVDQPSKIRQTAVGQRVDPRRPAQRHLRWRQHTHGHAGGASWWH